VGSCFGAKDVAGVEAKQGKASRVAHRLEDWMADLLPVFLKLKGGKCVVVGAGTIGCQKLAGLLESCADAYVVASVADVEIQELVRNGWPRQ